MKKIKIKKNKIDMIHLEVYWKYQLSLLYDNRL